MDDAAIEIADVDLAMGVASEAAYLLKLARPDAMLAPGAERLSIGCEQVKTVQTQVRHRDVVRVERQYRLIGCAQCGGWRGQRS